MRRLLPKFALATVAAVGLYIPALGLPLPDPCLRTVGVAGAAPAPSPSCGGDLRECLRKGSEMMEVNFAGTYVSAKNVSRCVEIFSACIHGAAGQAGNPAPPTSPSRRPGGEGVLPQRFAINGQYEAYDCSVNATAVTCTVTAHSSTASADSWTATVTGTVSGLNVTGTMTIDQRMEANGCVMEDHGSGPMSAVFDAGGSVALREGPFQWQRKPVSCANSDPWTQPGYDATATWAPK